MKVKTAADSFSTVIGLSANPPLRLHQDVEPEPVKLGRKTYKPPYIPHVPAGWDWYRVL